MSWVYAEVGLGMIKLKKLYNLYPPVSIRTRSNENLTNFTKYINYRPKY